ncbi:unnamed protein product [Prunus armeniaca]|uniref:RING-type E3 ubiquitin transferase n=1 Tax=Prunus armeniaca TaxID=36596 RepID=A0A6J5XFM8_PRUAR|nr:hypothetical protein GBA52_021416 [Prunus armeniaca]CAB4312650.1 unnamed protein product [Prunus armeniaca]
MFSPTDTQQQQQQQPNNPLKQLFATIFSYDGNVLLAALVSLLLVILFVLLLHVYAKWFLAQAHHRRRRSSMTVSRVLGPNRFQHFHTFTLDPGFSGSASSKGLDLKTISAIPLFVYKTEEKEERNYENGFLEMECVICLSPFEDKDVGRNLPKCGHCFHVECIDMWLGSHMNCPICRAPIVTSADGIGMGIDTTSDQAVGEEESVLIDVLDSGYVENDDLVRVGVMRTDSEPTSSSSSSSSSSSPLTVGCSLKRMLSRNRPEISKVFPTTNGNDHSNQMDD